MQLWETVLNRTCPSLLRIAYAEGKGANEVLGSAPDEGAKEGSFAAAERKKRQQQLVDNLVATWDGILRSRENRSSARGCMTVVLGHRN